MPLRRVVSAFLALLWSGIPSYPQAAGSAEQIQSHLHQAQEFLRANQPQLAIKQFKAILALEPGNVAARSNLGTLLYFQGDYENAALELRAALNSEPTLWKTQTLLGMC